MSYGDELYLAIQSSRGCRFKIRTSFKSGGSQPLQLQPKKSTEPNKPSKTPEPTAKAAHMPLRKK